ncbi:Cobalamin biosynthesis protein, aminopropanol attachment [gamma proteobacterium HdN1]|nr:Cobalamin biosynthesis protein, aminopropanol attachment [gamma proteobacterium HdN1]
MSLLSSIFALFLALLLDHRFGEVPRWHPLAGFGKLASALEKSLNHGAPKKQFWLGIFAWSLLVGVPTLLTFGISYGVQQMSPVASSAYWHIPFDAIILYFCIGYRSLCDHTTPIAKALEQAQQTSESHAIEQARNLTGRIVSRDTHAMTEVQCSRAAIESLLENGNDALFATLFWYLLLGPAGAILHRLANTLDAMWGYHNNRFEFFGKGAARIDDVLAYIPARLTALSYALTGKPIPALRCWAQHASRLASPNGGPCMSAGAGSLGISLGGPCRYHGQLMMKPFFGTGPAPAAADIFRAQQLLRRSLLLWLAVLGASAGWVLWNTMVTP